MMVREIFSQENVNIPEMFSKFLPVAMKVLKISKLPKIQLESHIEDEEQPTFGRYVNDEVAIHLALSDRHPVDILRTLAHELVHFKQHTEGMLGPNSGDTGSPEENQAHEVAGVIMRHFNKMYPAYLKSKPLMFEGKKRRKVKKAAYGPGAFGMYGTDAGYSGDGGVAEAFGPLPRDNLQIRLGKYTVDIERVGKHNDHIGFAWHDSQGREHYEEVAVGDLGSYDDLIAKIKGEISYVERHLRRKQGVTENFADGKKPGRKGLAKRSGVNCKASVSTLRNVAKNSSGEKQRMAHWCANMKSGRKK